VRAGSPADGILREGDALVEVDGANVWKSKAGPVSKKLIGKSVGLASGLTPRKHSTFPACASMSHAAEIAPRNDDFPPI
jgi:hypothetical protein